jgi:CheY-like chemotaxis protein
VEKCKANILVVDDDEGTRCMMAAILTPQGYKVISACDGREAIEITHKQKPDLVLMDMMMPIMDGLAACLSIKSHAATKNTPVVMVTAVGSAGNKSLAKEIWKADGYLTKPIDIDELCTTLDRFLGVRTER